MGYRVDELVPGQTYHLYTRGVEQRVIFRHDRDRQRFLALMLHCMPRGPIISFSNAQKLKHESTLTTAGEGLIDLLGYCLMSNHIHLLIRQNTAGGTALYMQRLLNSYAKYFNMSLQRSGSLFTHPFKAVLVDDDGHLLHISRYIHLNPYVAHMIDNPLVYRWSSLPDYVTNQSSMTCHTTLLQSLMEVDEYKQFVVDEADYARSLSHIEHLLIDYGDF